MILVDPEPMHWANEPHSTFSTYRDSASHVSIVSKFIYSAETISTIFMLFAALLSHTNMKNANSNNDNDRKEKKKKKEKSVQGKSKNPCCACCSWPGKKKKKKQNFDGLAHCYWLPFHHFAL